MIKTDRLILIIDVLTLKLSISNHILSVIITYPTDPLRLYAVVGSIPHAKCIWYESCGM